VTAAAEPGRDRAAAGLGLAAVVDGLLALAYTVALARLLGADGYGSLAALVSLFLVGSIAGSALQVSIARSVSAELGQRRWDLAASVRSWAGRLGGAAVAALALSLVLREPLADVAGVEEEWAAAFVAPAIALDLLVAAARGALLGLHRYRPVALSVIGVPAGWLLFGGGLALADLDVAGAVAGMALAELAIAAALLEAVRRALAPPDASRAAQPAAPSDQPAAPSDQPAAPSDQPAAPASPPATLAGPPRTLSDLAREAVVPIAALGLFAALQNLDVVVVKHAVEDDEAAGSYAAAAVAAKAILWVAIGVGLWLVPEAARMQAVGGDGRPLLGRAVALVGGAAVTAVLIYALAGESLLRAVFGGELTGAADALPTLAGAMALLACAYLAVQLLLAYGRRGFLAALAVAAAVQVPLVALAAPDLETVALALAGLGLALAAVLVTLALRSAAPAARKAEAGR
jgi:O-antigen/teichoic acid export membrane protein